MVDTQATVAGRHFAWITKTAYGYKVTVKYDLSEIVYVVGSMKEAKDTVKDCAVNYFK